MQAAPARVQRLQLAARRRQAMGSESTSHRAVGDLGGPCRSSLSGYDAFDSASFCRQRFWLFIAYVVSFSSIIGAAAIMLQHMAADDGHPAAYVKWTGWVRPPSLRFLSPSLCVSSALLWAGCAPPLCIFEPFCGLGAPPLSVFR